MALPFDPKPGTIVICDFRGFIPPEMVKPRPAIVVSPKFRRRQGLCTIVPLSTTPPQRVEPYHHFLTIDPPLPYPFDAPSSWVKGDLLYTVSYGRLDLPHERQPFSKRVFVTRMISQDDLEKIRICIQHGLGILP